MFNSHSISTVGALNCDPGDLVDGKSIPDLVMAWCHQATSHYLFDVDTLLQSHMTMCLNPCPIIVYEDIYAANRPISQTRVPLADCRELEVGGGGGVIADCPRCHTFLNIKLNIF